MDELIANNLAYLTRLVGEAQDSQLPQLDRLRHALYKGIADGLSRPSTQAAAIALICQLFPLIAHGNYGDEWLALLARARPLATTAQQIDLLLQEGKIHRQQLAFSASIGALEQALIAAIRQDAPAQRAAAHLALGNTFYHQGDYAAAQHHGEMAAECAFPEQIASIENLLGLITMERGNTQRAITYFNSSLAQRTPQKRRDRATTYANLGKALAQQGAYADALAAFADALTLLAGLEQDDEYVRVLVNKSAALIYCDRLAEAEATLQTAAALDTPHPLYAAMIATNYGYVLRARGRPEAALKWLLAARPMWETLDDEIQLGNVWGEIGHVWRDLGERTTAIAAYQSALTRLARFPDHVWAQGLWFEFERAREQVDQA